MLIAIVGKLLWSVGGVVVGWVAKKWHVQPFIDAVEDAARERIETPVDRPSKR